MAERWRELVGPVGRAGAGRAQRDHRRARGAGRPRPGGERRADRGHRGGAAGAAGGGRGRRPSTAPASWSPRPRSTSGGRWGRRSTSAAPTRSGPSTQAAIAASGRGPDDVVIPVVGECDDGYMADSRTVVAADVEAALGGARRGGRRGHGRRRHRDDLLRLPRRDRHRLAAGRRAPRRRPAALQLRRPRVPGAAGDAARRPSRASREGSCIAVCATDAPLCALQLRRLALRPLLGLARAGSYASDGSGEIGLAFCRRRRPATPRRPSPAPSSTPLRRRLRGRPRSRLQLPAGGPPRAPPRRHAAGRVPGRRGRRRGAKGGS